MAKTPMEGCSIPLINREILIETPLKYDIAIVGMAIEKKKKSTKMDAGEGDVSGSIDRHVN